MKRQKPEHFDGWLKKKLKSPSFRKEFRQARLAVEVAHHIVKLRERLKISQKELARRMGTKQQSISRLERGDYEGFTLRTLIKIAEATRSKLEIRFRPRRGKSAM